MAATTPPSTSNSSEQAGSGMQAAPTPTGSDVASPSSSPSPVVRCRIFLAYTSNLVSAGVREHIRWAGGRGRGQAAGGGAQGMLGREVQVYRQGGR